MSYLFLRAVYVGLQRADTAKILEDISSSAENRRPAHIVTGRNAPLELARFRLVRK